MKRLIFIISILSFSCFTYAYQSEDVHKLTGQDYFPEVKRLLGEAKKSIYISMFIATYYSQHPNAWQNQLIEALIKAHNKGVKVKVFLDQSRVSSPKEQLNDFTYYYLKDAGIQVGYDILSIKLHDKLIVIDEKIIIIGSHNWSKNALKKNREASVVIYCPELAKEYIEWIESTPVSPKRNPPPYVESQDIYIPYRFLADPELGVKLSEQRMRLYLYLLRKWQENGYKTIYLDYDETAKVLGINYQTKEKYRDAINRLLRALRNRFKLINFRLSINKPTEIELLDYKEKINPFKPDPRDCFRVPGIFWYGWFTRLSLNAKYFYFINLIETELSSDPDGWWSHSQKHLYRKYHLHPWFLRLATSELNKYNLLEVEYGHLIYPFKDRFKAPKYRLLPLYSWEWLQEELDKLREIYGREKVEKAREWAMVTLDENNLEVIEKLIYYANLYGEEIVQYAVNKVSRKKIGNKKRNFLYLEGIILGEVGKVKNNLPR